MKAIEDYFHSIIDRPWEYVISEIHLHNAFSEFDESYLEIVFVKGSSTRRLRFLSPQDIKINLSDYSNGQVGEMCILDIRDRRLDRLMVQVCDFGASGSPIYLYAREVIEIS